MFHIQPVSYTSIVNALSFPTGSSTTILSYSVPLVTLLALAVRAHPSLPPSHSYFDAAIERFCQVFCYSYCVLLPCPPLLLPPTASTPYRGMPLGRLGPSGAATGVLEGKNVDRGADMEPPAMSTRSSFSRRSCLLFHVIPGGSAHLQGVTGLWASLTTLILYV